MTTRIKKILQYSSVTLVAGGILFYGLYQARDLLLGPQIEISTPQSGSPLSDPLVTIEGHAYHIVYLSLNNRQIYIDDKGHFSEKLLVPEGYTIMKLEARDKFGRTVDKLLELTYASSTLS